MSMKNIQAITVPFLVSTDGLVWKQLVCLSEQTLPLTSQTTETNTQCGVAVGLGPVKFAPTFNAVSNLTPDAGQIGFDEMKNFLINQTLLYYKISDPESGSTAGDLYVEGRAYVTALTLTATIDDVVKFSGTLSGVGTPSGTPGVIV